MSKNNFHVGDEVVFINKEEHIEAPYYYPEYGTVGVVTMIRYDRALDDLNTQIQWPRGSTSHSDVWWVNHEWIEPLCPDQGEIEKSDLPISFLLNVKVDV